MNSQMEQLFKILLAIAITFILGVTISNTLESKYSSFPEDEIQDVIDDDADS